MRGRDQLWNASEPSMKGRYIGEALSLIDRAGGLRGLNLRELSRSLGCAHTNAYNYFNGLEDLVWQALGVAIERQLAYTAEAVAKSPGEPFEAFLGSQFDFAVEHPGWYRLIWLEPVGGEPPPELLLKLTRPARLFEELVAQLSPKKLSQTRKAEASALLHTYLHGAVCKVVSGRLLQEPVVDVRRTVIAHGRRLFDLLTREPAGSTRSTPG